MDSSPDSLWFDGAGDSQSCWITSGPKSRWWVLAPRVAASRESVAEQMGSKMGHPNSDRLAMISFMFARNCNLGVYFIPGQTHMFPASQKTIQTWASGTRLRAMKQRGSMRNDPWLLGQFGEEEGCQCMRNGMPSWECNWQKCVATDISI